MVNISLPARLWKIFVFLTLASLIAFSQLLPLSRPAGALPGPELLFLMAAAWTMRRPRLIPMWVFLLAFFAADILFVRPLGLHTALALIAIDALRWRAVAAPRMPFLREWLTVAAVVATLTLAELVILTIFFVPQPALGLTLIRLIFTVLVYPLVVLLLASPFGLNRPKSNDKDLIVGRTA